MSKKIAIIGAGLSGLAAAHRLAGSGAAVQVFEKSKGLSGRAASRSKNGCRYDYGANYFKVSSNEVARLLFEILPTEGLCRIVGDVDTFDESGRVTAGDPKQNSGAKWSYRDGISTIGKRIVESAGLRVAGDTAITRLVRQHDKWTLGTDNGIAGEGFDAVLLTPPAPQTIGLLETCQEIDPDLRSGLVAELGRVRYHAQFTVVLNFKGTFALARDAFALINSDRRHDIAWMSHENRKPAHVPAGESLFVVQMSPDWTARHYESPREEIIAAALEKAAPFLGGDLPPLNWSDSQRWRYAHPYTAADPEKMRPASTIGLYFAGDAFVGKGRVPGAIETGFAAARGVVTDQATR
jgi:predicted NAD/FAD-dependent oxidoreductase